jgi:hypothetical protein
VQRLALVWGAVTLSVAAMSFSPKTIGLRPDTSRIALASLAQEYDDLQQWAAAIATTTDTLSPSGSERARVLAQQLARLISPLEGDFEKTTAALSTEQLEAVLPLWERMAFAHAGLVMLQEDATQLGSDPALDPAELQDLVGQLSAVLDFATEIQQEVVEELTAPPPTPIRIT